MIRSSTTRATPRASARLAHRCSPDNELPRYPKIEIDAHHCTPMPIEMPIYAPKAPTFFENVIKCCLFRAELVMPKSSCGCPPTPVDMPIDARRNTTFFKNVGKCWGPVSHRTAD